MSWLMNKRLSMVIYHYESSHQPPKVLDLGINTFYLFRGLSSLFEDVDDLSKSEIRELYRETLANHEQENWVNTALALMCDHLILTDEQWGPFADDLVTLMTQLGPAAKTELKVLYAKLMEVRPCNVILSSAQRDDPEIFFYTLSRQKLHDHMDLQGERLGYLELMSKCRELREQSWRPFTELKEKIDGLG